MVESMLYLVHALHYILGKLPLRSTKDSTNILASHPTQRSLTIQSTVKLVKNVKISQSSSWKVSIQGENIHSLRESICGTPGFEELSIYKKLCFPDDIALILLFLLGMLLIILILHFFIFRKC